MGCVNQNYSVDKNSLGHGCISFIIAVISVSVICVIVASGLGGRDNTGKVIGLFSKSPKFQEGDIVYLRLNNRKCIIISKGDDTLSDHYIYWIRIDDNDKINSNNLNAVKAYEYELSSTVSVPELAGKTEIILEKDE